MHGPSSRRAYLAYLAIILVLPTNSFCWKKASTTANPRLPKKERLSLMRSLAYVYER